MAKWTPERRARFRALIHQWKPWERSTGPRTPAGKAIASRNAYKGGRLREHLRELRRQLRQIEVRRIEVLQNHMERPR